MYLSKNSRYVLKKAQFLSPSFLKGVEKNLSVKTPKDDPSKPPLRVNIPDDSKPKSTSSKTSAINSGFEDGLLPNSEKEIQFSKFTVDDILVESTLDSKPSPETVRLSAEDPETSGGIEQKDYNEGLRTVFQDDTTREALGDNYFRTAIKRETSRGGDGEQDGEKLIVPEGDIDPKPFYILLDGPEKNEEKYLSVTNLIKEKSPSFFEDKGSRLVRGVGPTFDRKSKSVPRLTPLKSFSPHALNANFESQEADDGHVLNLKLNKSHKGILCVPERDVTTRQGDDKTDGPIKVRISSGTNHPLRKQVAIIEERPEVVRYGEDERVAKMCKNDDSKGGTEVGTPGEDGVGPNSLKEGTYINRRNERDERVGFNVFVRDDFGTVRTGVKTYPFKMPNKRQTSKGDDSGDSIPPDGSGQQGGFTTDNTWTHDRMTDENIDVDLEKVENTTLRIGHGRNRPGREQNEEKIPPPEIPPAKVPPDSQYVNVTDVLYHGPVTEDSPVYRNLRDTMYDIQEFQIPVEAPKPTTPKPKPKTTDSSRTEGSSLYCNIDEVIPEGMKNIRKIQDKKSKFKPKRSKSKPKKHAQSKIKNGISEPQDFQPSARSLSIECENSSSGFMPFGSAFPPLLHEALKNRFKFRKEFLLSDKWKNVDSLNSKTQNSRGLEENSILFPEKESEDLNYDALFFTREELVENLVKSETSKATKPVERSQSDLAAAPVDSLTVMKKVKEIVQFDLNNAVKLFNEGGANLKKEQSSVVVMKGEGVWEVDKEDLARHIEMRRNEMRVEAAIHPLGNMSITGDGTGNHSHLPLYLPPETEKTTEMKLLNDCQNSVVSFDSKTNGFFINKEALAKAISERTDDSFEEVNYTLTLLAEENVMNAKSGDSILVYDVETQKWKVDFSILEKRKQQQQIEEELTKRSEAILETFERLEKEQFNSIPKPTSSDKRTFDYEKEEWKAYNTNKGKPNKTKYPFKKSNAEEIRKKNSDMFDNMFDGKKKIAMNNSVENVPNPESSNQQKFCCSKPTDTPGSTPQQGPGSSPNPTKTDSKAPALKKSPPKEEDHFWESFLRIQTPPQASKELPSIKMPPPDAPQSPPGIPQPKDQPTPAPLILKVPKIEEPKPKKKIEEPRFRIHLPFIRDKKVNTTKLPEPTSKTEEKNDSKKAPPISSTPSKKEDTDPKIKAPPPPSPSPIKGDPPKGLPNKPPPTIGSPLKPSPSLPSTIKIQDPKPLTPKNDKNASATEHYVSDKIIEISRNKNADHQAKIKSNKIETVKLNITSDTRMPSKITEINLNKNSEEKGKETTRKLSLPSVNPSKKASSAPQGEGRKLNKHFDKFKTSFSDPDFEEKLMKIKTDLESNPNLKKLDNWSKTLVLHDIMKPPENLETWLKDETDKMATLLLKVLQEAGDAKTKKKQLTNKTKEKLGKGMSNESIRKKKHVPENFFFRVQTMNLAVGNEKKLKPDDTKMAVKSESLKNLHSANPSKHSASLNVKIPEKNPFTTGNQVQLGNEESKSKTTQTVPASAVATKDLLSRFPLELTDEIPGPEILKKISNAWKILPIVGSQMTIFSLFSIFQLVNLGRSAVGASAATDKKRKQPFSKLFNKYGPIVNVRGPISGNVVLLHKPEHLITVFEQDNPLRSVFDSLEQSRRDLEEKSTTAIITTEWSKPEWNDLRQGSNDPFVKIWETYFGSSVTVADSLLYVIRKNRNGQDLVSEDFMNEIKKWSLEGLCNVLFEKSFGYLEGKTSSDSWIMEPEKLFMAVEDGMNYLNRCERGFQAWRFMNTPSFTGLSDTYRTMSSVIAKQINQAEINLKNKGTLVKNSSFMTKTDLTFIESMLLNDGMSPDEITCNLADILLIGANTMNSAFGFLLYNLAQNIHVQKKLFVELKETLPSKNSYLDYNSLNSLKYLQACLKETLRLQIPVPIFYRMLQNDTLVAKYIIPKGTYVVMDYGMSSMKEHVFEDPERFIPERWLEDDKLVFDPHPFASFPFCQGPKADLVKRVVEMQLMAGAAKILRNFGVEYYYGDIRGTDTLISFPDKPLKLNFVERDC